MIIPFQIFHAFYDESDMANCGLFRFLGGNCGGHLGIMSSKNCLFAGTLVQWAQRRLSCCVKSMVSNKTVSILPVFCKNG